MQKIAQKKLLWLTAINEIAFSFLGIFWLFFVKNAFNLSIAQTVSWFAITMILFGIFVYPINKWGLQYLGNKNLVLSGIFLEALYLLMMALGWTNWSTFWIFTIIFTLQMICFWPSYNYLISVATKNHNRGQFLGNAKIILIAVGIMTPIFTGLLFDKGWEDISLWIALSFYLAAMWLSQQIFSPTTTKPIYWKTSWERFKNIFLHRQRFWGFMPNITDSIMWTLWPFYFQWVVGTFTIMGIITGFVAIVEMIMARILGKITDKFSDKSLLKYTAWARVLDLNLRSLYLVFQPLWFVTFIQSLGAILGPPYQIPYEHRIIEVGEALVPEDEVFDYFVIREIYIGIGRGLMLLICALGVHLLGIWSIGIMIGIAGLFGLGAKKL